MEDLDYWRLCDELNIIQAALLVVGEDPTCAERTEEWDVDKRPKGYEAAKTAISHALRSHVKYQDEIQCIDSNVPGEPGYAPNPEYLESLRVRSISGKLIPDYDQDINGNFIGPIENTIDLWHSTVDVGPLKIWLHRRGFSGGFFFPETGNMPDYLDENNPRYAPKLAASIRAWEAVTDPGGKSPKKALDKWLREHAAQFGLTGDDGLPTNQAIEDCSKVANWNSSGGAPKTPDSTT